MSRNRVVVIGKGFGREVHAPAFKLAGSEVVAVVTREWREAALARDVDIVSVAVPARAQVEIAVSAAAAGKHLFLEKPLASDTDGASEIARAVAEAGVSCCVDFEFTELTTWRVLRRVLEAGEIGALRHVSVRWVMENASNRVRQVGWKADVAEGGGALNAFGSHAFYYLEEFFGPVVSLSARLLRAPSDPRVGDTLCSLTLEFASGLPGVVEICAHGMAGPGHRIEVYGDAGTLVLHNPTSDYLRGFELWRSVRGPDGKAGPLERVCEDSDLEGPATDGRVGAVARLVRRWLGGLERAPHAGTGPFKPGIREALRVQDLLEAARRSDRDRRWISPKRP